MHYMNAWLKRCDFNLDLNRESVSEPPKVDGCKATPFLIRAEEASQVRRLASPSACPEAFDQRYGSANYNVQQNI